MKDFLLPCLLICLRIRMIYHTYEIRDYRYSILLFNVDHTKVLFIYMAYLHYFSKFLAAT